MRGILRPAVGQQNAAAEEPLERRIELLEFSHIGLTQAKGAAPATDERIAGTTAFRALVRILQQKLLALTEKCCLALAALCERAFNLLEAR